jgi:predicted Zn-dependent peptidase
MVLHPNFEGLDIERTIVEEEIQADLDEQGEDNDPHNMSRACVWHQHPMGRRITGSVETLHTLTQDHIRTHHLQHYAASNMALCIAGKFNKEEVQHSLQEIFTALPEGERAQDGIAPLFNPPSQVFFKNAENTQTSVQLSFEALPDYHPDFAAQELLVSILDGGMGSRLRQGVCDRKGLVYDMVAGLDCYSDCGLLDIELKTAPRRAASAVCAVLEVLHDIRSQGVTQDELELAKESSLHALEFRSDSVDDLAHTFGTQALFNPSFKQDDEPSAIQNVTAQDIQHLAQDLFSSKKLHVTVTGPEKNTNVKRIQKEAGEF